MNNYTSVEPHATSSFQITWEATLKCNLDCSYCSPNDHNNKIPHPSLEDCLKTVDFLLEYVDVYMQHKNPKDRIAGFNIFGGESLFHPNIVEILSYMKQQHKKYEHRWHMGVQTVTNAVVKEKIWNQVVPLIDYFTVSYHSEATQEQQDVVRKNLLMLKENNKSFICSILMHAGRWDNCQNMIAWCKENDIPYLPRQLDHSWHNFKFWYNKEQTEWWDDIRGIDRKVPLHKKIISIVNLDSQGRSCCGGKELSTNGDTSCSQTYVPGNNFRGWSCSVNYFFAYVKQVTKEVFLNKDCQMNFNQQIAPIGTVDNGAEIIAKLRDDFKNNTMPVVVCNKSKCWCGLCAPKAHNRETFDSMMKKYVADPV